MTMWAFTAGQVRMLACLFWVVSASAGCNTSTLTTGTTAAVADGTAVPDADAGQPSGTPEGMALIPAGDSKMGCVHAVWNDGTDTSGQGCDGTGTEVVGSKAAGKNGYGLFDMAGNVSEWTADWLGKNAYSSSPAVNPTGADPVGDNPYRVHRGGSFNDGWPGALVASVRGAMAPSGSIGFVGFRCARSTAP